MSGTERSGFSGAIFDVDGVLVDSPHEEAWRESLRELMAGPWADIVGQTSYSPEKFTPALYHERMSGKPRTAGATAALEYFGVPDIDRRVKEYGEHKQEMIIRLISEGRFSAYDDAVRFVLAVRNAGIPVAAASSSKNAKMFLEKIDLSRFGGTGNLHQVFDVDVSGRDFAHGKPDPEIFLTAARELGVEPADAFVAEDAVNGIQAAKAGGFGALGVVARRRRRRARGRGRRRRRHRHGRDRPVRARAGRAGEDVMSGLTVGVDVGGTKIAAGVVDEAGKLIASTRRETPATDTHLVLEAIADAVRELSSHHQIDAVGIGAAGLRRRGPGEGALRAEPGLARRGPEGRAHLAARACRWWWRTTPTPSPGPSRASARAATTTTSSRSPSAPGSAAA